jgi:hypothetical protein
MQIFIIAQSLILLLQDISALQDLIYLRQIFIAVCYKQYFIIHAKHFPSFSTQIQEILVSVTGQYL